MSTDVGSDDGDGVPPNAHDPAAGLELLSVGGDGADRVVTDETVDHRGPSALVARVVLVVAVLGLFFAFARSSSDGSIGSDPEAAGTLGRVSDSTDPSADSGSSDTADAVGAAKAGQGVSITPGLATAEFRPWPDPPEDHDPHVAGRPGQQEPVGDGLIGKTLVYVNDHGRPTVLDLSTGDQRELDIAGPRDRDTFLVEFGRIVATPGSNVDLPQSLGRAFLFTAERTAVPGIVASSDREVAGPLSGPTLCLDEGGCRGAPMLDGTFGDDLNRVTSLHGAENASQAIAEVVGSDRWRTDGRWTFFALDSVAEPDVQLRVPTPMNSTVVWLIEQLPPEQLTG